MHENVVPNLGAEKDKFIAKVYETDFIVDAPRRERALTPRTPKNVETVTKNVLENSSTSIRHRSSELKTSVRRILRKDVDMTPSKVQFKS